MNRSGGLVALLLGGLLVFGAAIGAPAAQAREAAPADARYTPGFVTQTDEPAPWDDCLWASGAMLVDKWTGGEERPDRRRLRAASRDFDGGSTFADLARGVSRTVGIRLRWSPGGGDPMTWPQLLDRLAAGAGAIIAGTYGRLGEPYVRWSRRYAADPNAAGHAMYVERYQPERGRMWLMDPLGRHGYAGEWVPVGRIHDFVWQRRGLVWAIVTPTSKALDAGAPGVSLPAFEPGALALEPGPYNTGQTVALELPFHRLGEADLPTMQLAATWMLRTPYAPPVAPATMEEGRFLDEQALGPIVEEVASDGGVLEVEPPTASFEVPLTAQDERLTAQLPLPSEPGLWDLSIDVLAADGQPMAAGWQPGAPFEVEVWADRGAVIAPALLPADEGAEESAAEEAEAGEAAAEAPPTVVPADAPLVLQVAVQNAGRRAWRDRATLRTRLPAEDDFSPAELVVSWIAAGGALSHGATVPLDAGPGEVVSVALSVRAPALPGSHELRFDVRDDLGLYSAAGLPGASISILVESPPGSPPLPGPNPR